MTALELTEAWQEFGMAFEINFLDFEDVRLQIPRSPRIYTDAPLDILESFGQRHDPGHTNLQARIAKTAPIPEEYKIVQDGNYQHIDL